MNTIESTQPAEVVCDDLTQEVRVYTILLVDDEKLARMVIKSRLKNLNYRILEAENGRTALEILKQEPVDLVLSDWIMPELDGPGLCEAMKQDDRFRSVLFILMTANDQPGRIVEGLERGADDFLLKVAPEEEMIARIGAGIRMRQQSLDLTRAYDLIFQQQQELKNELYSAAEYVRQLLPTPGNVTQEVRLEWEFLPCSHLGGDLFQVNRWGDDHLSIIVVDMSGHGTSAALRAVSLGNWFKAERMAQLFPSYDPGEIVTRLNAENPMTEEGEYFTIWVGVLHLSTRVLRFASAGHPGSILVRRNAESVVLGRDTLPTGFSSDEIYCTECITLDDKDRLYLFSDGIYEVVNAEDEIFGRDRLKTTLEGLYHRSMKLGLKKVLQLSRSWQADGVFGDDVALICLELKEEMNAINT